MSRRSSIGKGGITDATRANRHARSTDKHEYQNKSHTTDTNGETLVLEGDVLTNGRPKKDDQTTDGKYNAGVTEQSSPMRWWWFGQRDPVARFTLYVGFFTALLVVIGALQWLVFWNQLSESNATERAWLNPENFSFKFINRGNGSLIYITGDTENTGHTPATFVIFSSRPESNFIRRWGANIRIPQSDICDWEPQGAESNIYPGEKLSYERIAAPIDPAQWEKVQHGDLQYYIRDCVTYTTLDGDRKYRRFCFKVYSSPIDGALRVYHCQVFNRGN